MRFLSTLLAVILGLFIFFMFFFFGIVFIGAMAGSGSDTVTVKSNSVLELDLSGVTYDYAGKSNYKDFDYFETEHDGFSDVLRAIDVAKDDNDIKGISILNLYSEIGVAQAKALRDKLLEFRKSGKFVLAYANVYTQKDYYISSTADKIYINPTGNFDFRGLSSEIMFFKDLQEKSGVKIEVVRHGKYKSAVEPFLENKMSEANREQVASLLNSVWSSFVADIAETRKVSVDRLNSVAENLLARTPEMAKTEKLVDVIAYEDVYHNDIRKRLKIDKEDSKYNKVKILDYAKKTGNSTGKYSGSDRIAVIYAQGEILSGEGNETYVGEGSMRRALQQARKDKNVKAIVIRVDSPGGSALTSDLIWRETELTRKVKPVIISMGNLAASGGYYIACNGDRIFAEPTTITGSIGVFGMLPNLTALSEKVGIHTEQVNTHRNAAGYSPFKPLDDNYRSVAQEEVERIYTTFVSRVAAGRKMSTAQVDSIGQGRIWSGIQAKEIGLVDEIGGLDDAIAAAGKAAKITKWKTRDYPEYEKDFSDLLKNLGIPFAKSESILRNEIGEENYRIIEQMKKITARSGMMMLMPYEINIR